MNYEAYFLAIATELVAISHTEQNPKFSRVRTADEVLNLHRNNLDFSSPVMLLNLPMANLFDPLSDNVHLNQEIEVSIVQKVGQSNDYSAIRQIQNDTRLLLLKIIGRIQKDHQELVIHGFDRNRVTFEDIFHEPMLDVFGCKASLTLHQSVNPQIHYKTIDWL